MKKETKEEVGGGIFATVFLVSLVIVVFVIWSPAKHYLGKWNDFWNRSSFSEDSPLQLSAELEKKETDFIFRYSGATKDCRVRVEKYYNSQNVAVHASSTGDDDFYNYDCYGLEYIKIP